MICEIMQNCILFLTDDELVVSKRVFPKCKIFYWLNTVFSREIFLVWRACDYIFWIYLRKIIFLRDLLVSYVIGFVLWWHWINYLCYMNVIFLPGVVVNLNLERQTDDGMWRGLGLRLLGNKKRFMVKLREEWSSRTLCPNISHTVSDVCFELQMI